MKFISDNYQNIANLINLALVIATVVMVYETRKSVNESIKSREENNSAEVIAYIKAEYHRLYIIIENIGPTMATDIKIKTDKTLKNSSDLIFNDFNEIKFLPPNYTIKSYFDETYSYKERFNNEFPDFKFVIEFKNIYGKTISRQYDSDLGFLNSVGFLEDEMKSVEMSLHDINENLLKINQNGVRLYNNKKN